MCRGRGDQPAQGQVGGDGEGDGEDRGPGGRGVARLVVFLQMGAVTARLAPHVISQAMDDVNNANSQNSQVTAGVCSTYQ